MAQTPHPSPEKLTALYHRRLPAEESAALWQHIAACDECAACMAQIAQDAPLLPMPHLEQQILAAARKKETFSPVLLRTVKVITVAAACLLVLFAPIPDEQEAAARPEIAVPSFARLDRLAEKINDFSRALVMPETTQKEDLHDVSTQKNQ